MGRRIAGATAERRPVCHFPLAVSPAGFTAAGYHPPMLFRRATAVGVAAVLVVLAGCTSGSSDPSPSTTAPPNPTELLTASAKAMSAVTSAHFTLTVDGELPDLTVQKAEGDLTAAGDAQGTGTIKQFGQLIEVDFVLADDKLYLKGPTGGFAQIPAALAGQVYDPSVILNPDKGISAVLSSVTGATLVSSDDTTAVVSGTVPKDVVTSLVPGLNSDVKGTFTIEQPSAELTSAEFELNGADGKPATVDVQLSALNEAVTISPPS
jgi:lipoprotein LprG